LDDRAKSPSDAGLDPPLQETKARQKRKLKHTLSVFEKEYISTPPVDEQELRPHLFLRLPARQNEGTPLFSSRLSRSCLLFVKCGERRTCSRNIVRTTKERSCGALIESRRFHGAACSDATSAWSPNSDWARTPCIGCRPACVR
jgi:hypothetical protein